MSSSWEIVVAPTATKSQDSKEDRSMVRCASLFSQLVALFNKGQFYHLVKEHPANRYSKGFGSWDHFVAMLFCQLAQGGSECLRLHKGTDNLVIFVLKKHYNDQKIMHHLQTV